MVVGDDDDDDDEIMITDTEWCSVNTMMM